jgi:hypothetical protein
MGITRSSNSKYGGMLLENQKRNRRSLHYATLCRKKTYPGKVRRTADPSAALLGMTKERVSVRLEVVAGTATFFISLGLATAFPLTTTLPFVIPSAAEGSAVLRTLSGEICGFFFWFSHAL